MIKKILIALVAFTLIGCSDEQNKQTTASAEKSENVSAITFAAPGDTTLLTITGAITQFNSENELQLDRSALLKLPQVTISTTTLWTDGKSEFSGPLLRDILAAAGNSAKLISAIAANEYAVEIPLSDTQQYQVILALEKDGKKLSIREKGPLWVIYPWSDHEELRQDKYYSRSIWQLKRINLHD
ncbi:MAG: molybdopterin-dependent oxidoreductase [Pseudomonadales bacterium]|nr:molybdopterin-dependent oxidoreductase [Pseudomonadales bacterium]NRA14624.1 molybdopterin-dependent oxidoreductase [Oceanospirillaceae bacterium]